jgi:hypothetical protein
MIWRQWLCIARISLSRLRPPLSVVLRCAFASVPVRRAFDNSPAIYGWVHNPETTQVPSGTKEPFCRP